MDQLPQNIRLMGDMLGKIIVQQAGEPVFELEETLRSLSKGWCDGDDSASSQVSEIIDDMVDDLPLTSDILMAFSTYFQLVNLAEEHERIRIWSLVDMATNTGFDLHKQAFIDKQVESEWFFSLELLVPNNHAVLTLHGMTS